MNRTKHIMLAAMGLLMLAGCNSGEDFSEGTSISGLPLGPSSQDPLNPDADSVEVELVAALADGSASAVVGGIGYRCGDVDFYMVYDGNSFGLPSNIARCPLNAREIEFFIGRREADTPGASRFFIGSARIPRCSGRADSSCGNSGGVYQFSLSDLEDAPARIDNEALASSARTALLSILDSYNTQPGDELVLEIPAEAHDVTSDQFGLVPNISDGGTLDVSVYDGSSTGTEFGDFVEAWDDWRTAVAAAVDADVDNDFDSLPAWPDEPTAEAGALVASSRVRSGLFSFGHNTDGFNYIAAFPDDPEYSKLFMAINAAVFPSGTVRGIGAIAGIDYVDQDGDPDTPPTPVFSEENLDVLSLDSDSVVGDELFLGGSSGSNITGRGLLSSKATELFLSGRFLGSVLYDNLPVENEDSIRRDFTEDYPKEDDQLVYTMVDAEEAQLYGTLFDGSLGSMAEPVGFRGARSGVVAGSLEQSVMDALPEYYNLTFYKACVTDTGTGPSQITPCNPAPDAEIGVNYDALIGDFVVEDEQVREYVPGGADQGQLQLQFLPGGRIITDRNQDCSAVDASLVDDGGAGIQEYEVGFVTRTLEDGSANILLYMAADKELSNANNAEPAGYIPQFGTLIQGRLDLSDAPSLPIYRLSDANFASELRAGWVDLYQQRRFARDLPEEPSDAESRELTALSSGAVEGSARYATGGGCALTP